MRRFIENHRSGFLDKRVESGLASLLLGQKTLEAELVARQSAAYQGRHKSCCAWQSNYLYACFYGFAGHQKARVADTWCTGITYHSHRLAALQSFHHTVNGLVLIELMVRKHSILNLEVLQQYAAGPSVLCQNQVGLLQHLQGSECDIFQISYRCRYQVQCPHFRNANLGAKINIKNDFADKQVKIFRLFHFF